MTSPSPRRPRRAAALGLVVGLLVSGCTGAESEPDALPTSSAPSAPASSSTRPAEPTEPSDPVTPVPSLPDPATAPVDVVLLQPGRRPRVPVRVRAREGSMLRQSVVLTGRTRQAGRVQVAPPATLGLRSRVEGTSSDAVVLHQVFGPVRVAGRPGEVAGTLGLLLGASGPLTVGRLGVPRPGLLRLPDGTPAPVVETLDDLRAGISALAPVWPSDPVGVGARWRARTLVRVDGLLADRTTSYRLVSLVRGRYEVEATTRLRFRPTTGAGGRSAPVSRGLSGFGAGRAVGRVGVLVPRLASSRLSTTSRDARGVRSRTTSTLVAQRVPATPPR